MFLHPLLWKAAALALAFDWASKALVNFYLEPIDFSKPPRPDQVLPHPPQGLSITHAEHWRRRWSDVDGLMGGAYPAADKLTPFDFSEPAYALLLFAVFPVVTSFRSIG